MRALGHAFRAWIALAVASAAIPAAAAAPDPARIDYNRQIRPILSDRCFPCHGPDAAKRKADLRLDTAEGAHGKTKKSETYPVVAGHPERSGILQRLTTTDADDRMPPPESKLSVTPEEIELIRRWILQGGEYNIHWAFAPLPDRVPLPSVKHSAWPRQPLDRFILERLEREGLDPAPEADRARWLRRASYALTGLPPSPEETAAFEQDAGDAAFERVVDRLLASPRFGERMAVPWLDAARYGDSYGYQSDLLSPTWPWRDWVVRAFNSNLPYDQFLTWQIAGDLLPGATREQRLATAFNRLHRQTNEGGSIEEEWRTEYTSDRVHTLGTAVLALTLECSRCHDHKYDPVTMRDYYSLGSFFNSIDEYGLYNDSSRVPTPSLLLPTPAQEADMKQSAEALETARTRLREAESAAVGRFEPWRPGPSAPPTPAGLAAHYALDALFDTNRLANSVTATNPAITARANRLVEGRSGQALEFTGDDELTLPRVLGSVQPWERYTVAFWVRLPAVIDDAVLFHRTEGTDVGFHGTELSLQHGRLFFVIKRFWPGNAIAVRTTAGLPRDRWTHLAVAYDGTGTADGMRLVIDGQPAPVEIVRNRLFKSPQNSGQGLAFGQRFRSAGLKGGLIDEIQLYDRALSTIEIRSIAKGQPLPETLAASDRADALEYYRSSVDADVAGARQALSAALKTYLELRNPVLETMVMEELPEPRPAFVLARGQYDAPKTEDRRVSRSAPAAFPQLPRGAPPDRLGLSRWLNDPKHPLTARVEINRLWLQLFGAGLVSTPENFGLQGTTPTHPQLLDWLARDFINSGWDVKAALKRMVLSATYRQSSALTPQKLERDPENILLSRGPSFRLSAEMIRDTALAASGLLDLTCGGPPVSPYQPGDLWRESNTMSPAYKQSVGTALYRRSLYSVWKRTAPLANMTAFDVPSREVCAVKRTPTSTPIQACVLLNDVQFVEAARALAQRALTETRNHAADAIDLAFRRSTGRAPSEPERVLLQRLLDQQRVVFANAPEDAARLLKHGASPAPERLPPVELAAFTVVAQAILNLDATVWSR